ncbi:MAG: histidine phosphatase family protein [Thiotrichales bacterium]|nr:histidine phosphatase family protein [Thiotrichales bacterium]
MTDGSDGAGFFFIRHGQTTANRDGVRSGAECDTHMTELGREQIQAAGRILRALDTPPSLILCSPLSRTVETAHIINARLDLEVGLEVRIEPGLVERRLGDWNGRSIEETQRPLSAGETPPGGESNATFKARVLATFRSFAPLWPRWPLIVSSRGVARILIEQAGRGDTRSLANGAILRVVLAGTNPAGDIAVAEITVLGPREEVA